LKQIRRIKMSFERELIKTIEHGCPFCEWDEFTVKCHIAVWVYPRYADAAAEALRWQSKVDYLGTAHCIACDMCKKELWTAEGGWIPELKKIIEGE